MLGVLLVIGGLVPLIQAQDISFSVISDEAKLITGRFLDSLLLSLPSCSYAGQNVDVNYVNVKTNQNYTLKNAFTVPYCDISGDPKGSTAFSRNIGYQLMNLNHSTEYKVYYTIGFRTSNLLMATTQKESSYTDIAIGFPGRSAAMLVITVILSVAMFILLVSIIIGLAQAFCGI